jgi:non-ribosomal peptide synthetase component F
MLDTIADGLAGAGFSRGARVGIALPDGPELAVALLAVCSAATCAPLNADLDEDALVRLLHNADRCAYRGEGPCPSRGARSATCERYAHCAALFDLGS